MVAQVFGELFGSGGDPKRVTILSLSWGFSTKVRKQKNAAKVTILSFTGGFSIEVTCGKGIGKKVEKRNFDFHMGIHYKNDKGAKTGPGRKLKKH